MKILYDFQIFWDQEYGGPSRYFYNLINEFEKNSNLKVCSPFYINKYLKEVSKKKNIFGIYLNNNLVKKVPKKIKIQFENYFFNPLNQYIFNKYSKYYKPDIIHSTFFNYVPEKKYKNVITVYDLIHEIFHKEYKQESYYRPKKKALENADKIICISKNTASDLIKFYDVEKSKIEVIYLASDLKLNTEDSHSKIIKNNYLLYVGKRKGYKNFNKLVKAFSISKKLKENFQIICFGGGSFENKEKEFLSDNGLNHNNVKQIDGNDRILKNFYTNAVALIYPSIYEGFGLPILEAMQCKCPVFCSNTSSMKEIGGDGVVYFNPNEIDEIRFKLELHLFDNIFLEKLKKNGLLHSNNFSWKRCSEQTMKVYKELKE